MNLLKYNILVKLYGYNSLAFQLDKISKRAISIVAH